MRHPALRACLLAASPAAAQPATWTNGTGNGLWHTAGNWSTNAVPTGSNDVVIPPNMPGVVAQAGVVAATINARSPLSIGHGASSFGASNFTDLNVTNETLDASGPILISGASTMAGVTFAGPVQWKSTGNMRVNPGLVVRSGTTFINEGSVRVEGSLTLSGVGAMMDHRGVLELAGAVPILSNGLLSGPGTFRKSGAGSSVLQCRWQCEGYVEIQGGDVRLQGPTAMGPSFVLLFPEAVLAFDVPAGTPFFHSISGANINGAGNVEINAGGTLLSQTMRVVDDTTFNVVGSEGLWLRGGMLYVGSGGVVRNTGKLTWHDTRLHGPGELVNEGNGRMTFVAAEQPVIGPDATVTNRALAVLNTHLYFDQEGSLVNDTDGIFEMEEVIIHSPLRSVGLIVNRGLFQVPPEGTRSVHVEAEIRVRLENVGGGTLKVTESNGTANILKLTNSAEFGDGDVQITSQGAGSYFILGGAGRFEVTGAHTVTGAGAGTFFEVEGSAVVSVEAGGELLLQFGTGIDTGTVLSFAGMGGTGPIRNMGRFTMDGGTLGPEGVFDFRNEAGALMVISPGRSAEFRGGSFGGTFTNSAEVRQFGNLEVDGAEVENHGAWSIRPGSAALAVTRVRDGRFRNPGRLETSPQGQPPYGDATFSPRLDNTGHVLADRGRLVINGPVDQIVGAALVGGTWEVANGGRIVFTQGFSRIDGATIVGGTAGIPAAAAVREIVRNGAVRANQSFQTTGPVTIREGGQLGILPGGSATFPGGTTNGAESGPPDPSRIEQRAEGEGPEPVLITPVLVNHAWLFPGGEDAAGPFNLGGDLDHRPRGTIHVELGGTTPLVEFDRVSVDGDAALDGTLSVRLIGTFIPEVGQVFDILSVTGTLRGTFATHDLPRLPGGAQLAVVYGPQGVSLRVESACYADCDPSSGVGVLDIFDFLCFQNAFAGGDPYACDCDLSSGPRVCDIFDFLCFQNAFAAGCP